MLTDRSRFPCLGLEQKGLAPAAFTAAMGHLITQEPKPSLGILNSGRYLVTSWHQVKGTVEAPFYSANPSCGSRDSTGRSGEQTSRAAQILRAMSVSSGSCMPLWLCRTLHSAISAMPRGFATCRHVGMLDSDTAMTCYVLQCPYKSGMMRPALLCSLSYAN